MMAWRSQEDEELAIVSRCAGSGDPRTTPAVRPEHNTGSLEDEELLIVSHCREVPKMHDNPSELATAATGRPFLGFWNCMGRFLVAVWVFNSAVSLVGQEPKIAVEPASPVVSIEKSLFDGETLQGWKKTNFGGEGNVDVNEEESSLVLGMGSPLTGITWADPKTLPYQINYEISLEARRVAGSDFFCGLTFPHHDACATLILGGWGGSLVGISSLDRADASENDTMRIRKFENGRWYKVRLRVLEDRLQAYIDDHLVVDCLIRERKLGTRMEVRLSQPLGISCFETKAEIRKITMKPIDPTVLSSPLPAK